MTRSFALLTILLLATACGRTGIFPFDSDDPVPPPEEDDETPLGEPKCGDGITQAELGEECDDGIENADDVPGACRVSCLLGVCGDGVPDPWEECDEGEFNSDTTPGACRTTCILPPCGDEIVDPGEECDDGNDIDDDLCTNDCRLSPDDPCSPCDVSGNCARPQDLCLPLQDGFFCGLACANEACPDGFSCFEVTAVDGQVSAQCVPDLGFCAGCLDRDDDGFGAGEECLGIDCDDSDPLINPAADELCDGIDNNCNGQIDEPGAIDAPAWFRDRDGDNFGDPNTVGFFCDPPLGWVADDTDCNDDNPAVNPDALEICDDADNNCNEENDEGCPPDLIIDGDRVEMSGEFLFDRVEIFNGGVLDVANFDGIDPTSGCIRIEARVVFIRQDSGVQALAAGGGGGGEGESGGFGNGLQNVGPGGGGYGGEGGAGEGLSGGSAYGTSDGDDIDQGSNGGSFFINAFFPDDQVCNDLFGLISEGGHGGGCVSFEAPQIVVEGFINADGENGEAATDGSTVGIVDGAGGGSGGGIRLVGDQILVRSDAVLSASGGRGGSGATYNPNGGDQCIGNGGGGGAGGRIKIVGRTVTVEGAVRVTPGFGGDGPQSNSGPGDAGTIHIQ